MTIFLQLWAGLFYLSQKIFLSVSEAKHYPKSMLNPWEIIAWSCYILGLPAWVIIFVSEKNWIAAALESGGAPAMVLALLSAIYLRDFGWLKQCAKYFTYSAIILGVIWSVVDYGGFTDLTQMLEIGIVVGFLLGTYLLAQRDYRGWLFYLLMNGSNLVLMLIQDFPWLALQQFISTFFVLYGYKKGREKSKTRK